MKLSKINQHGFSPLLLVAAVAIVGVIGFVGWNITQQDSKKTLSSSGQATDSDQKETLKQDTQTEAEAKLAEAVNDSQNWTVANLPEYIQFSVPDGWQLQIQDGEVLYSVASAGADALEFKEGVRATIEKTQGGRDGNFRFFAAVDSPSQSKQRSFGHMTKVSSFDTKELEGTKYNHVTSSSEEGTGIGATPVGTVENVYYFNFQGSEGEHGLYVSYTIYPGEEDRTALVEAALKTAKFANTD